MISSKTNLRNKWYKSNFLFVHSYHILLQRISSYMLEEQTHILFSYTNLRRHLKTIKSETVDVVLLKNKCITVIFTS